MFHGLALFPAIEGSGFTNRYPLFRAVGASWRKFVLFDSVSYDVGHAGSGDRITVAKYFVTDFASIPRIPGLWFIFPPMGRYAAAAIIHDFLYVTQTRPRVEADYIFFEAMGALRVNIVTRCILWSAVRVGGWRGWNNSKKELQRIAAQARYDGIIKELENR